MGSQKFTNFDNYDSTVSIGSYTRARVCERKRDLAELRELASDLMSDHAADSDWLPDDQLVAAFSAGTTRTIADLSEIDRCWVVAGMSALSMTADEIAGRLKCSLRLVRTIKAQPMTRAFTYAATETTNFVNEIALRESTIKLLERELEEARSSRDRYKGQLDNVLDAQITGVEKCGRCGHAFDFGNTYWETGADGRRKRRCRSCNRRRQQDYRNRRSGGEVSTATGPGLCLVPDLSAESDLPAAGSVSLPGAASGSASRARRGSPPRS